MDQNHTKGQPGPSECQNCAEEWEGDCPRCFAATHRGCPHGEVCRDCRNFDAESTN